MVSFVENKLTGLSEEERKFIRENGDIVEEYLKGNKSAEEIADMIMSRFDDLIE
jgi:nitrogenase molybdenum-iron protein alpha/beta subunit